jgi:hypothetical protein
LVAALAEQALGAEAVDQAREDGEHVDAHGVASLRAPLAAMMGR